MDKELFIKLDKNSQSKDLNNEDKRIKRKQLIIYISSGVLLIFIIIVLATRNNAQNEIILENKAQKEIAEENNIKNELLEENGFYYHLNNDDKTNEVLRFYKSLNLVIRVIISSPLPEIRFGDLFPRGNWFNETYKISSLYDISISGNKISFGFANILYKGTLLDGQKMEISINGNEIIVFKFISFDVLKDIQDLDLNSN